MNGTAGISTRFLLFIAQGFGIGRLPAAPGTFGSILGIAWFALLLLSGNLWVILGGTIFLALIAVPICTAAEKILSQRDPGCVVLDEIAAIPLCFWFWSINFFQKNHSLPTAHDFFATHWPLIILVFVAFRLFDIWKPWPVGQSQSLPSGWGVVVDDLLAALYVNMLVAVLHFLKSTS